MTLALAMGYLAGKGEQRAGARLPRHDAGARHGARAAEGEAR